MPISQYDFSNSMSQVYNNRLYLLIDSLPSEILYSRALYARFLEHKISKGKLSVHIIHQ